MSTDHHPLPLHARFLLLAHDPATGRPLVDDTHLKPGLAGAALLELTHLGVLRLEGDGRQARLRWTGVAAPAELEEVLRRADDRSPKDAVGRFGGAQSFTDRAGRLRDDTWRRLEAARLVRPVTHKVLGLVPRTRWQHLDDTHARLVEGLHDALTGARPSDPALPPLACVAQATGLLRRLYPDVPRKELEARAAALADGSWGGPAVVRAISDIHAAITAATVAAITPALASG